MWHIWKDSPSFGCNDKPSYYWYARQSVDGHVISIIGPYNSYELALNATREEVTQ